MSLKFPNFSAMNIVDVQVLYVHVFQLILFGGFVSGELYSWDLTNSKQIHSFQGHHSAVTGFEVNIAVFLLQLEMLFSILAFYSYGP